MNPTALLALIPLALVWMASPALAAEPAWRTQILQPGTVAVEQRFEGVVEAERQTVLAAQVAGAVVEIAVKLGDRVKAGQLLMRLDARAAEQGAQASEAQVQAARASLTLAEQSFQRQQQLRAQGFISQGALEQTQAQFKSARAQAQAQLAAAQAARSQTAWHRVTAPYAGVVAELPVALGDMALPGRPLLTLFDPQALRVSASLPQALAAQGLPALDSLRIELPALGQTVQPTRVQRLPLADASSQTVLLRLDLPAGSAAQPGQFARLIWPGQGSAAETPRLWVPQAALVQRAELRGVYVLVQGQPQLRWVRLGRLRGDHVEVLAGLKAGEQLLLEPQRASRLNGVAR